MKFPANLYAVRNSKGQYTTNREGIGEWARKVDEVDFFHSLQEAKYCLESLETRTRINTGTIWENKLHPPFEIVAFVIEQISE